MTPTLKLAEVAMVSQLPFLFHTIARVRSLMTRENFTSIRRIVGPRKWVGGVSSLLLDSPKFSSSYTNIDSSAAIVHTIPTQK